MTTSVLGETREAIQEWFFHDYLPRWVAAGAEGRAPDFITEYWEAPLWVSIGGDVDLLPSSDDVVGFLTEMHERLRAAGYTHTVVPDSRIMVFTAGSADVSVIWSRRRADESEIERLAVSFTVLRTAAGWRVVTIRALPITGDRLSDLWPLVESGAQK